MLQISMCDKGLHVSFEMCMCCFSSIYTAMQKANNASLFAVHVQFLMSAKIGTNVYIRHLILHSEKRQIGSKFRERAKLAVHSEKEPNYQTIQI